MGRTGLEPATHGFSIRGRNTLTTEKESTYENNSLPSATTLAKTLLKFPELRQIIEAWKTLDIDQKNAIMEIVKAR